MKFLNFNSNNNNNNNNTNNSNNSNNTSNNNVQVTTPLSPSKKGNTIIKSPSSPTLKDRKFFDTIKSSMIPSFGISGNDENSNSMNTMMMMGNGGGGGNNIILEDENNKIENELFFLIWRNKGIKKCIFYHLEIYNCLNNRNEPIRIDQLPSIESMGLSDYCKMILIEKNEKLELQHPIPKHIEILLFSSEFDKPIKVGTIPDSVVEIEFIGEKSKFNQTLKAGQLPKNLKSLKFSSKFNQMVTSSELPSSLTFLKFGDSFDQLILKNFIPCNVKTLIFGLHFDQPLLPGYIPDSVTHLEFQCNFNQPFSPNTIPKNVKYLTIYSKFPLSLNSIPNGCTTLNYGGDCSLGTKNFPDSIKNLHFLKTTDTSNGSFVEQNDKSMSSSSSNSTTSSSSGSASGGSSSITPESISRSITNLSIELARGPPHKKYLPMNSITTLELGINSFKKPLKSTHIPPNCTNLSLNIGPAYKFPQLLAKSIPSSVTSLVFGPDFNLQIMANSLSINLRTLDFSKSKFNQLLTPGCLPALIDSIKFGSAYNQPISPGVLTNSSYLTSIEFGQSFNQPLVIGNGNGIGNLPITLNRLKFSKDSIFNSILKIDSDSLIEEIEFSDCFNRPEQFNQVSFGCNHLLYINFGNTFNLPLASIEVTGLAAAASFSTNAIPNSVQKLIFGDHFNQLINNLNLPKSLTSLTLGKNFQQPLSNLLSLKKSLIQLKLNNKELFNSNNNNSTDNQDNNDINNFINNNTIKKIKYPCLISNLNHIIKINKN